VTSLFWEYDVAELDWDEHRDFVIERVLSHGTWDQICWLREFVSDAQIRRIVEHTRGRNLSAKQLRFWQLVLEVPSGAVDEWLSSQRRQVWDRRSS
jgi:hypothetical protein